MAMFFRSAQCARHLALWLLWQGKLVLSTFHLQGKLILNIFHHQDVDRTLVKRVDSVEEINDWQQFLTFRCRAEVEAILARSKKTLKQTKRDQYVIAQGTGAGTPLH